MARRRLGFEEPAAEPSIDEQLTDCGAELAVIAAQVDPEGGFDPALLDEEQKQPLLEALELALAAFERMGR